MSEFDEAPSESSGEGAFSVPSPSSDRSRVLSLARRITDLVSGSDIDEEEELIDAEGGHRLAHAIKPYVDRLVSLNKLLNPVERILHHRDHIWEMQAELADDVAAVEVAAQGVEDLDPAILREVQSEIAAVKKDRKLYVVDDDDEEEDDDAVAEPALPATGQRRALPLLEISIAERMERIFGPRFIDLRRVGEVVGGQFDGEEIRAASSGLDAVWGTLFETDDLRPFVEGNRLKGLRKAFADYALIFRTSTLPSADSDSPDPCTLQVLRSRLPQCFMGSSRKSAAWYEKLPLSREPIDKPHWALVDRQYLNCTFKKPNIRLLMYARANGIPGKAIRQKSVLEDVYDRAIIDSVLEATFFDNCNNLTRTIYQQQSGGTRKLVYTYYRDGQIRISGKRGVPHWRPGRSRWPGVLPAIVFRG